MFGNTDGIGTRSIGDSDSGSRTGLNINVLVTHAGLLNELQIFAAAIKSAVI